jgi:hypothetical protein
MGGLLSTRGRVLLAIHRYPQARPGAIASMLGVSERRVQQVVRELLASGQLRRLGSAWSGRYAVVPEAAVDDGQLFANVSLGEWLAAQPTPGRNAPVVRRIVRNANDRA